MFLAKFRRVSLPKLMNNIAASIESNNYKKYKELAQMLKS